MECPICGGYLMTDPAEGTPTSCIKCESAWVPAAEFPATEFQRARRGVARVCPMCSTNTLESGTIGWFPAHHCRTCGSGFRPRSKPWRQHVVEDLLAQHSFARDLVFVGGAVLLFLYARSCSA